MQFHAFTLRGEHKFFPNVTSDQFNKGLMLGCFRKGDVVIFASACETWELLPDHVGADAMTVPLRVQLVPPPPEPIELSDEELPLREQHGTSYHIRNDAGNSDPH